MSYSAGEALVLTQLRAISSGTVWTTLNTSRGNWKLLDRGDSDHYGVLKPGPGGQNGMVSASMVQRVYSTIIEVWQSYVDDGSSLTNLESYMEGILDRFDSYRKLGDTGGAVYDAQCASWSEVTEQWTREAQGPRWLRQDFTIAWKEDEIVTFAE